MKKIIASLILLSLFRSAATAQSFYSPLVVQDIKITFFQSNWDHLLDSLKDIDNGDYLLTKSVEINGQVFDSVGVKYKGNSSYNDSNKKNPMHIELDFVRKNQNYQGFEDIKLSNAFADPTFVREPLSFEILRKYTEAPRANHARVTINGTYWGVYGNVESINKRFIRSRFKTDGNNPFFKCNPEDFGGPGTGGNYPDLVYSSADSSFYYNKYDIQSDYGWAELLDLMSTLKNSPASIEQVLDVDRALWMLAYNDLFVNLDSYTGAFAQNYYLYRDRNERWLTISWDLNMSFGGFPLLNSGGGGILSLTQMQQLDPLSQSTNSNRPLIKQLLANATYKRMYLAHMRTMLKENVQNDYYIQRAAALQEAISASVLTDTKKFFSNSDFSNNLQQSVNGGFNNVPGLTELMVARNTFLSANSNFTATPPTISNVIASLGSSVQITAQVQNANNVLLGWRADSSDVFVKISMYDDGQHGDGAANDGRYGGSFPLNDPRMQYFIYAENNSAGIFSPERAEHEFYVAVPSVLKPGDVAINEFMASNTSGEVDEAGEVEDWLELYNNSSNPLSLTGYYLTDNPNDRKKWAFPAGISIPANGFLIVWLDNDDLQGPIHANFKLSAVGGEHLMLSDGANTVIDSVSFGQQQPDVSYGRYPNGTGPYTTMPTTFSAVNSTFFDTENPDGDSSLQVFPNPAGEALLIRSERFLPLIQVFDAMGKQIATIAPQQQNEQMLTVRNWPAGLYTLHAGAQTLRFVVKQ